MSVFAELGQPLTPREEEVMRLIMQGDGNAEIASRIGVSENTVKVHLVAIFAKLGARNRAHAVLRWFETRGAVEAGEPPCGCSHRWREANIHEPDCPLIVYREAHGLPVARVP